MKILIDTDDFEEYSPDTDTLLEQLADYELVNEIIFRDLEEKVLTKTSDAILLEEIERRNLNKFALLEKLTEAWDTNHTPHLWRIDQIEKLIKEL
mgnify:CR=1 FL=1